MFIGNECRARFDMHPDYGTKFLAIRAFDNASADIAAFSTKPATMFFEGTVSIFVAFRAVLILFLTTDQCFIGRDCGRQ